MKLTNRKTTPPPPIAELIADELVAGLDAKLAQRIEDHMKAYALFWDSEATPDEIAEQIGDDGKLFIDAAAESLRNIAALASLAGQTLDDALPPQHYAPRRAITFDGNKIVLAPPAEGYDAWGRLIFVPVEPTPTDPQQSYGQ